MSYLFTNYPDSFTDLSYTFHYSKLSCWKPMYFAHVIVSYCIGISGIAAFVTRLRPSWHKYHLWFGRLYVIFMLWGCATSLLIHNTGLPIGVLWSFLWVMLGLSVGWLVITVHQQRMKDPDYLLRQATATNTPQPKWKQILQRMFSLKAVHGCLMFVSFLNIFGRIPSTPKLGHFECYTYPAYKPVTSEFHTHVPGSALQPVEMDDPNYSKQPWANKESGWAAGMSVGLYVLAFVIGVVYLFFTIKPQRMSPAGQPLSPESVAGKVTTAPAVKKPVAASEASDIA
jgi:hypothetical protein